MNLSCDLCVRGKRLARGALDAMTVVTTPIAIAVIVDTIGIATATGVMTVIVTVPIRPEIITTINCKLPCRHLRMRGARLKYEPRVQRCFRD
jgi:hypothetical protein